MTADELAPLKTRLKVLLPADADGRITYSATATAITGRVPGA